MVKYYESWNCFFRSSLLLITFQRNMEDILYPEFLLCLKSWSWVAQFWIPRYYADSWYLMENGTVHRIFQCLCRTFCKFTLNIRDWLAIYSWLLVVVLHQECVSALLLPSLYGYLMNTWLMEQKETTHT